jgi:hypothetical protein
MCLCARECVCARARVCVCGGGVVTLGLMVVYLQLDPRFVASNPSEDGRFLRAIKIRSTTSFRGEVKPSIPCHSFVACSRTLQA